MSGGSHDYLCFQVKEEYVGAMHDKEMDDLMDDISKILHGLEWYDSGDIGEDTYRKQLKEFKKKWFTSNRNERLKEIVSSECDKLKHELIQMIGATDE